MGSSMKTVYTIEQLKEREDFTDDVIKYLLVEMPKIAEMFDNKFDWKNCPLFKLAREYIFLVCRRNGEVRGHMLCYVFTSPLDVNVKILYQLSFYVKPDSGRTAYHLFHKFIDIGKERANHVITMLTTKTNLKPSTLEKLGFKELETLYRMEIK